MNDARRKSRFRLALGGCLLALGVLIVVYDWRTVEEANQVYLQAAHCSGNLRQIGIFSLDWAAKHEGRYPTNFAALQAIVESPVFLACPSEKTNPLRLAKDWSAFDQKQSSYELVTPGMDYREFDAVFARCKLHGYTYYGDGIPREDFRSVRGDVAGRRRLHLLAAGMCFVIGIVFLMRSPNPPREEQPPASSNG